MNCPWCQHKNEAGAKFCEECAAPLARVCAQCGRPLSPTARFCPECAHPTGLSAVRPPAQRFGAPESYTPKHLAEKIFTSKSALEGERKLVTVLFADLKGSMELLADRDPEEARRLLDPVLERMMEAVHRYEGTVNQVMGDGIMALFGAPVAHEDHAVRACYAAHDMQAMMRRYTGEMRHAHGIEVQVRVGLNSGEVVVRAIGSDLRMDYTAVGQTTHLAARMEQLAPPGTIRLTADTLRLAEGYIEVKPLGQVPVKGLETPIDVYEMVGASPRRSRLHAAAARGLTRFVGREAELEQLRQTLARAAAGHGQVVAVVGEPGVGKSRLVWEVTHSHRVHGWLVLQAGSVSYGKATAYLPVVDLLKGYFAIEDRDGLRAVREKVTGKLLTLDRALESSLPPLLSLLDVPSDDPQWPALDPSQRRRQILDAVKRLLLRESQVQPLLVVFEDLHWIDAETLALLDGLVESLPAARLLLLVNYRPEYQHLWGSRAAYTQLRLDPLPPETAEDLLGALLGPDAGLDPLKRVLIERTEGNPFFLEESVRALVEAGSLLGERGAYRLARALPAIHVPATVQAVLAGRIDRLPPADKALLQTASVIGKDVPFALLQAIAEPGEDELHAAIGRLQVGGFLYEVGLFPDLEYTFRHALTHEVAYGSLLRERRCALHAKIAEAIERLYAERLSEQVERLAHHAIRGELWQKAVQYLRQAGAKAAARSAHREAISYFEQALATLQQIPEVQETMEQAIDLRFDLRNSLAPLGENEPMLAHLREAERLAEALDDQRRLAWVLYFMGNCYVLMGDHERALASGQRALAIGESSEDLALRVETNFRMGQVYAILGNYRRALEFLKCHMAALQGDLMRERFGMPRLPSVGTRTWSVWCLAELGEFVEGIVLGDEAISIARLVDHPFSLAMAHAGLGMLYLRKGDLDKAISVLARGVELCRVWKMFFWFPRTVSALGHAYALSGRVADALPVLTQGVDQAMATGNMLGHSLSVAWLAETHLSMGRRDHALELSQHALALSRSRRERGTEAWALHLLGEIASHTDPADLEPTEGHYRQALALAYELGMRPLVAHCHLGLGKLYRRTEDRAEAEEHLTTATTMYREMGMNFWLKKAETGAGLPHSSSP